ncbi:MAG: DUF6528 family protein [Bacteroidales bacterium]|nr:DUF6528 family protein [Bacteroidales bacterium]
MRHFYKFLILGAFCLYFAPGHSEEIIACGDDKVFIIDNTASTGDNPNIVWQWSVPEATDLPKIYQKHLIPFDECKPVANNTQLLLTSSGGGVVLLDKAKKKSLFYAYAPMAHSAECLPNGRIAVALSTHTQGNSIEIYDVDKPEIVLFKDSLYSGHGVVWMPNYKRLFALGFDELRSYSLKDWDSNDPQLKLEKKWTLPSEEGHDMVKISDHELLITVHESTYVFSIKEESFSEFEPLKGIHDVKSVNYNPKTKRLIYTKAETSWWTDHIYCKNPDKVFTFPEIKLYKVRVYSE